MSYFRRTASAGDTLMQMGRWFGFRELYHDLVRVFIGREEGRAGSFDIYEAFEGILRDEEAFREELTRYAMPADGSPPITPMQVQPLVASHLEWVRPTAPNKMFNALIKFKNFGGRWSEPTLAPEESEREKRNANEASMRKLISRIDLDRMTLRVGDRPFEAIVGIAAPEDVEETLEAYCWADSFRSIQHELEFMRGTGDKNPEINDWVFIAPQLVSLSHDKTWEAGDQLFSVKHRARVGLRVGVYTEPHHKQASNAIIDPKPVPGASDAIERLRKAGRGVFLFYPVTHHESTRSTSDPPTMGFALKFPYNRMRSTITFGVADPTQPDAPVVNRPSAPAVDPN